MFSSSSSVCLQFDFTLHAPRSSIGHNPDTASALLVLLQLMMMKMMKMMKMMMTMMTMMMMMMTMITMMADGDFKH